MIFASREVNLKQPSSYALHNLLAEYPSILRDKNILVFSFDAPYYFDATEISAFSAFYCLYSKLPSFVDVAARIVFQEITPQGASPVSVSGIAYDLITAMTPAEDQIIALSVDEDAAQSILDEEGIEQINGGSEGTLPKFKLGDILPVKTGIIVDHNNNPVPDGTVVRFTMNEQGTNTSIQQVESVKKKRTIPNVTEISSTMEMQAVQLPEISSEAKELLLEAAKDPGGMVLKLRILGGVTVQTNKKQFVESGNPRSAAAWEAAVTELCNKGLLQERGLRGKNRQQKDHPTPRCAPEHLRVFSLLRHLLRGRSDDLPGEGRQAGGLGPPAEDDLEKPGG